MSSTKTLKDDNYAPKLLIINYCRGIKRLLSFSLFLSNSSNFICSKWCKKTPESIKIFKMRQMRLSGIVMNVICFILPSKTFCPALSYLLTTLFIQPFISYFFLTEVIFQLDILPCKSSSLK